MCVWNNRCSSIVNDRICSVCSNNKISIMGDSILAYVIIYGYIGVLILNLVIYLIKINFTNYDPWGHKAKRKNQHKYNK